jgi:hypothetical protein
VHSSDRIAHRRGRVFAELAPASFFRCVILNRGSILARLLAGGLRELLGEQHVTVALGSLSN